MRPGLDPQTGEFLRQRHSADRIASDGVEQSKARSLYDMTAFLCFSKLMLVDVAAAWQRADAEQRLCVQNFLFRDGVAYHQDQKFLNTANHTLFQR